MTTFPGRSAASASPRLLALVLILAATASCPREDGDCVGAEGCACTGAGGCDPGLTCGAGTCTGTPGPRSGTGASAPAAQVAPLPDSAFVFFRYGRAENGEPRIHLWSFDGISRTERLLSRLGDGLRPGFRAGGQDISPDRRWVVFAAHFVSPTSDPTFAPHTRMIWKARVDGNELVQVTPDLADPRATCRVDTDCMGGADHECDQGKCTPYAWNYAYEGAVWAPDGASLFFHFIETYCQNYGCLPSPVPINPFDPPAPNILPVQALGTAAMQIADQPGARAMRLVGMLREGCSTMYPRPSPDGGRLALAIFCGLNPTRLGIINYQTNMPEVVENASAEVTWNRAGTGLYFITSKNTEIHLVNLADKKTTLIARQTAGGTISSFALSPDERQLLLTSSSRANAEGKVAVDLYLLDLTVQPPAAEQVTRDGLSFL
jgi:Tol biopolymer transport system component